MSFRIKKSFASDRTNFIACIKGFFGGGGWEVIDDVNAEGHFGLRSDATGSPNPDVDPGLENIAICFISRGAEGANIAKMLPAASIDLAQTTTYDSSLHAPGLAGTPTDQAHPLLNQVWNSTTGDFTVVTDGSTDEGGTWVGIHHLDSSGDGHLTFCGVPAMGQGVYRFNATGHTFHEKPRVWMHSAQAVSSVSRYFEKGLIDENLACEQGPVSVVGSDLDDGSVSSQFAKVEATMIGFHSDIDGPLFFVPPDFALMVKKGALAPGQQIPFITPDGLRKVTYEVHNTSAADTHYWLLRVS